MEYFKVTSDYIYYLKSNLAIFKNDVLYEINRQERDEIESAKREAYDDKLYERYDNDSIDEWLSDSISDIEDWARSSRSEVDSAYSRGLRVIDDLEDYKFYKSDFGYEFIVSFYNGDITRSKMLYNDDDVRVCVIGIRLTVGDEKFEFDPKGPDFTDWIEE